jgi:hypothetical protein
VRFFGKEGDRESIKANDMKRVFLLILLIVSLVELDWERGRIYLLSSLASLVLVVWSELARRRTAEKRINRAALPTAECVSPLACVADTQHATQQADHFERGESTAMPIRELVIMRNNSG